MRVLFHTYDLAFLRAGGGERVMLALQKALIDLGVQVSLCDPWNTNPAKFDLIHGFACRQTESWSFFRSEYPQIPLLVTPTLATLPADAPQSAWRRRWVDRKLKKRFALPDIFFPATRAEGASLAKRFGVSEDRLRVLPNGIDAAIINGDEALAWKRIGEAKGQPMILCAGRIEAAKNQLLLIEALGEMGKGLCVFLGNADPGSSNYAARCRERANELSRTQPDLRFHFLPAVAPEDPLLPAFYAAAHTYVQPSLFETFGMAALEAHAAGCNLALTANVAEPNLFPGAAFFSPQSVQECRNSLERVLAQPRGSKRQETLTRFRWSAIAGELRSIYLERLIRGNRKFD